DPHRYQFYQERGLLRWKRRAAGLRAAAELYGRRAVHRAQRQGATSERRQGVPRLLTRRRIAQDHGEYRRIRESQGYLSTACRCRQNQGHRNGADGREGLCREDARIQEDLSTVGGTSWRYV